MAEIVSVKSRAIVRIFEIVDSRDSRCVLTFIEVMNPLNRFQAKVGDTVKVSGPGNTLYLIDKAERVHKGRLILQKLMPPPPVAAAP
ncbi:MAG: hypothetical protein M3Y27_08650 [Acidobacteriota bacterium]|nr:hypothetical protein [Acidobacteriota bacterium]